MTGVTLQYRVRGRTAFAAAHLRTIKGVACTVRRAMFLAAQYAKWQLLRSGWEASNMPTRNSRWTWYIP